MQLLSGSVPIEHFSISDKMSWAATRETTREEDESYSLLGIFGVNLPPLYGEGRKHAFRRLQIEIMNHSTDHSIFAWHRRSNLGDMLASSPRDFMIGHPYDPISYEEYLREFPSPGEPKLDYTLTNAGLHIQLPMVPIPHTDNLFLAFLACGKRYRSDVWAAVVLKKSSSGLSSEYQRICFRERSTFDVRILGGGDFPTPATRRQSVWIARKVGSDNIRYGYASPLAYLIRFRALRDVESTLLGSHALLENNPPHLQNNGDTVLSGMVPLPHEDLSTLVLYEYAMDARKTYSIYAPTRGIPISTVAVGMLNGALWVFAGFGVNKDNLPLEEDSFEYPAGYAWRRYRYLFSFCVDHEFSWKLNSEDDWAVDIRHRGQAMGDLCLSNHGTQLDIHVWGDRS